MQQRPRAVVNEIKAVESSPIALETSPPSGTIGTLSQHHLDLVLESVVGQRNERLSRERGPVKADPGNLWVAKTQSTHSTGARNVNVGTTKKSMAAISLTWFSRNECQV